MARVGAAGAGARTLVRETGAGGLALSIYYPDSLIECLERHDPTRRLDDANVEAFSILVEELDHFLVIADRHRSGGGTTLLDLELHANVTKYLVLALFVARLGGRGGGRLAPREAVWIRWHLFEKGEYDDPDPVARARYGEARRLAARWLDRLGRMPAEERPAALRRFHRMPTAEKVARAMAP